MTKTQQLKKELMKNAGLEGQVIPQSSDEMIMRIKFFDNHIKVEPADNGVFGHDQLLTEAQADELIAELGRQRANSAVGGGRRKRAGNALFEPIGSTKRWDPNKEIQFMCDKSLGNFETPYDYNGRESNAL